MATDFLDEVADLCPHTIVWEALIARDIYGKPTAYDAPQQFRGRREFKAQRSVTTQGSADMPVKSTIWILGLPDVKYEDKVYVLGDDSSMTPPVNVIERIPDEDGDLFTKISF